MFQHWHYGGKAGEAPEVKIMPWRDLIGLLRPGPIAGGDNASIVFFCFRECWPHTISSSCTLEGDKSASSVCCAHVGQVNRNKLRPWWGRILALASRQFRDCHNQDRLHNLPGEGRPRAAPVSASPLPVRIQCESSAKPQCETPVRNPPRIVNYSRVVLEGEKHKQNEIHFQSCLSATRSAKYCKIQYGEGFALGFRIGFAVDSHWIRTGKPFAETWAAMRWVRPVGLLYHATDLDGPEP